MKKRISILIALTVFALLVSCTSSSPTDIVSTYLLEVKEGNNEDLNDFLSTQLESIHLNTSKVNINEDLKYDLDDALDNMLDKLEFNIIDDKIEGKSAIVTLELKVVNLGSALSKVYIESLNSFNDSFNPYLNSELSKTTLQKSLIYNINKAETITRTIKVKLFKENSNWTIDKSDSFFKSILGMIE